MDEVKSIINRVKRLQEFKVCVKLPKQFAFNGKIPYDMELDGSTATVHVYAESLTEAQQRAEEYFNGLAT